MPNDDTFMKITNTDIFNLIQDFKKETTEHFEKVDKKLNITNGKVKLNRWIATTALSLSIILITIGINILFSVK